MSAVGNTTVNNSVFNSSSKKSENKSEEKNKYTSSLQNNDTYRSQTAQDVLFEGKEFAISFVSKEHNMHWYSEGEASTKGIRFEKEEDIATSDSGRMKLSHVKATNINFGKGSFHLESNSSLKAQANITRSIGVYASGGLTANLGWLDKSFTGGLGVRGAVGAEVGPVYAEAFKETAMNYKANGYAVGVRLDF